MEEWTICQIPVVVIYEREENDDAEQGVVRQQSAACGIVPGLWKEFFILEMIIVPLEI